MPAVLAEHLRDLPADREDGVQRADSASWKTIEISGPRISPPLLLGQLQDVGAAVADLAAGDEAGRGVENAHDRLRGHRLARAGLTEDGQRLALAEVEGHAVDRLGDPVAGAELDLQIVDLEQQTVLGFQMAAGVEDFDGSACSG